jgi:molybdopterin converting factor small subunit
MEVEFVCHATIRDAVGDRTVCLDVAETATVGDALAALADARTAVEPLLFRSDGTVRPATAVLVDDEPIREGAGTERPLAPGQTITVTPAVAGGAVDVAAATQRTGERA